MICWRSITTSEKQADIFSSSNSEERQSPINGVFLPILVCIVYSHCYSLLESTHRPYASPEDRASPLPGHRAFDRPDSRLNRGREPGSRRSRVRGFRHRASWVSVRFPCLLSGSPGALIRSILDIRTQGGIFTTPGDAYTTPVEMWIKGLGESMVAFEIWSWIVIYFFRLPCTWHQISSSRNYWGITIYPG